ncbi:PREDICTED: uncharacterized protein LOC109129671 [Camelina sativa]|uniref:Uncharacterized protein LOC109129671 n=1 Tax=Camelina sativa TaxID=90675 RepID=A0ABM1R416_CAMSA|nr:PREDICTED: uncharacterized protein LOC109129671 [Camelina sativa]
MKLLRKTVKVTAKNFDGKTAMEIHQTHQMSRACFPEARRIFHSAKEKLVCRSTTTTLAEYLSKDLSFIEKQNTLLGLNNFSIIRDTSRNTSNRHETILVVAILMVTAACTAGLCPPGGFWQENDLRHSAGQMTMPFEYAFSFLALTGFAFLLSLYVILTLIIGLPLWKLIYGSTAALGIAISASYAFIFPSPGTYRFGHISAFIFVCAFPLIIFSMLFAIFKAFVVDKRRRQQVDFPASCFRSSHSYRY